MEPEQEKEELSLSSDKNMGRFQRLARRRLPILQWAPRYDRMTALADLVAGVTLGLTLVPQSIAYAALAGLPVQYGLYSSFMGTILYVFFGTVKEVSIGPTSLMALLTLQATRGLPLQFVPLLALLSGMFVTAMGLLRLGFLVDLISPAVTSGFTSGTAVIIVAAQLKSLLGISSHPQGEVPWQLVSHVVTNIGETRLADCLLSLCCCTVLLSLRKIKDIPVGDRPELKRALWLISIARNALVVCAASAVAYIWHRPEQPIFTLSGRVEPGLPQIGVSFSVALGNETLGFVSMAQELGSSVLVLPVIMVIANIAIAKAFSAGRSVDATQEMLTLGLVNMAGSLVHAMPTCGAFTRSAVSHSSGVRTPAAGLYSGLITLFALLFMTQYFYFIPKACLASVLVCAVIFMIDISMFARLWRSSRASWLVLALTTAVSVLWSVELAVPAGALADLAALLLHVARPALSVRRMQLESGQWVMVARPSLGVVYLNVDYVSSQLTRAARAARSLPLLVDLAQVVLLDYAALEALDRLIKKFKSADQSLIFYNAPPQLLSRLEATLGMEGAGRALRVRNESEAIASMAIAPPPGQNQEMMPLLVVTGKKSDEQK